MKRSELKRTAPMARGTSTLKQRAPADERKPAPGRKPRKCAVKTCRKPFIPFRELESWCSPECGLHVATARTAAQKAKAQRQERAADKVKRASLKSRADWAKEAQAAVNSYVRERDAHLPCISCGRHHQGQNHAGHYLARGSHPHLALVEANLAKQCAPCNVHLSGNQRLFRVGLIARIGLEAVEALEADQTPRKHTIEELQAIKAAYKAKLAELKRTNSCAI